MNDNLDILQEPNKSDLTVGPYIEQNTNKLNKTFVNEFLNQKQLISKNNLKVKPRFFKVMSQVLNYHFDGILNYLNIHELNNFRLCNKMILALIHSYYPKKLGMEVDRVRLYQEENYEIFLDFMQIIDSQIPICNNNWLDFDLNTVTEKLKLLDKNIITNLKSIKSLGKLSENVYAPFCILLGSSKKCASVRSLGWKKTFFKIIHDNEFKKKVLNLDLDNMNEEDILEALIILNNNDLSVDSLKFYCPDLAKLILWCQSVVSYHILVHPFTYRNTKIPLQEGTDMYIFITIINNMINYIYKFKKFLTNFGIMEIPIAQYVFNLQHNRPINTESRNTVNNLSTKAIGNILSYIPIESSSKLINISRKFRESFKESINIILIDCLKELFFVKLQLEQNLLKKLPRIFEHNILSDYFLMIDEILNSSKITTIDNNGTTINTNTNDNFISKDQLNEIKTIKKENTIYNKISKAITMLLNEKVEKKVLISGEIKYMYLDKLKQITINKNNFIKQIKNINKLDYETSMLNSVYNEVEDILTFEKLDEIKKMNKGMSQLLNWIIYIFEYNKIINPFDFIGGEHITNKFSQNDLEMIKYYCEVVNYLKLNLKIKFKFCKNFEFKELIERFKIYIKNYLDNYDEYFKEKNPKFSKLTSLYNETKQTIPVGAKPAYYDRILIESLKASKCISYSQVLLNDNKEDRTTKEFTNENTVHNNNNNSNSNNINKTINNQLLSKQEEEELGTIKEENSIIIENKINIDKFSKTYSNKNKNSTNINVSNNLTDKYNNPTKYNEHKINIMNYIDNSKIKVDFNSLPNEIIIKQILFFLDISQIPYLSSLSRNINTCIKIHMFIRIYLLNKEKKLVEDNNQTIIKEIEKARQNFFKEYEIQCPSKDNALINFKKISFNDITQLKVLFRKYNKKYEDISILITILFDLKPESKILPDGSKVISYFNSAKKIITSNDFYKKLTNFELETMPQQKFQALENLIESNKQLNEMCIQRLSNSLYCLFMWILGAIEFHRVVRNYSLSSYDYNILSNEQINFCKNMDTIYFLYYKMLRYIDKFCSKYEKKAQEYFNTIV